MKLATRINSYFRAGDKDLDRVFAQFEEVGLTHVDLNYPEHVGDIPADEMKALLERHKLALNGVALRFRGDFINGELGNADPAIARRALELCHEACDYCRAVGGTTVTIWLGFDGFDYSFQIDYTRVWKQIAAAYRDVCDYAPDLSISIEYKPYEERAYAFIDSMGITGMMLAEVDRSNLGVTLDYCHMLMKHENPAFACDLFGGRGKLFGVHLNDGYGSIDDGLMIGTATPIKTLEFLYYLKKHGYDRAIYFDTFPVIEDAEEECAQNIAMISMLDRALDAVGADEVQRVIDANSGTEAAALMRRLLCACSE